MKEYEPPSKNCDATNNIKGFLRKFFNVEVVLTDPEIVSAEAVVTEFEKNGQLANTETSTSQVEDNIAPIIELFPRHSRRNGPDAT